MTWESDFFGATYATLSTTPAAGVPALYYNREFLDHFKHDLVLGTLGTPKPLPPGEGKTQEWTRFLPLSPTQPLTALTEAALPNAEIPKLNKVQGTIAEYGSYVQISTLMEQVSLDKKISTKAAEVMEILADQAAEVMDWLDKKQVYANALTPLRADFDTDPTSSFKGVVDANCTTTSIIDAALTTNTDFGDANDDLNQAIITFYGRTDTVYGYSRPVTDYVASSGTMTVPALPIAPTAGAKYRVVTADDITTGDKLSYTNITRAVRLLRQNKAVPFEKGYVGVLDAEGEEQIRNNKEFIDSAVYANALKDGSFNKEIGFYAGVRWLKETNALAFPVAARGTAGTSYGVGSVGANLIADESVVTAVSPITAYVKMIPILGRNAFGVTAFKNKQGSLRRPPVYVRGWDNLAQPIPRFGTAGWFIEKGTVALNANYGVGLMVKADGAV